jgi:hypothetical protein
MLESMLEFYGIEEPLAKAGRIRSYLQMVQERRDWAGLVSRGLPSSTDEAIADSVALAAAIQPEDSARWAW